ncbi:MAG: response regulator transcription factor [Caldisericaceae bacterium]|nr:response regulator transcription factor [Caldisericaceae bacterium]
MVIRAIIVDDEEPAREEVSYLLSHFSEFEVIGEYENAFDALNAILTKQPDVVFFDVDMPGFSGIQLAESLKNTENAPLVVFITAYSEYAVKAFELNAADYLVKPIDPKRFAEMIGKIKERMESKESGNVDFIIGEKESSLFLLKPQCIIYFYIKNEKVFAKTKKGDMYCKGLTLQSAEENLKDKNFFRIHKGYLVNVSEIQKVIPWFKGKYLIEMSDGSKLPLSPHRQKEFREKFLSL